MDRDHRRRRRHGERPGPGRGGGALARVHPAPSPRPEGGLGPHWGSPRTPAPRGLPPPPPGLWPPRPNSCPQAYEELRYRLSLEFPSGYPYTAPTVRFLTPCYHPNVDTQGNICLDILKDKWSALYDVRTILLSIQSLLAGGSHGHAAVGCWGGGEGATPLCSAGWRGSGVQATPPADRAPVPRAEHREPPQHACRRALEEPSR